MTETEQVLDAVADILDRGVGGTVNRPFGGSHFIRCTGAVSNQFYWVPAIPVRVTCIVVFNCTNALVIGRSPLRSNDLSTLPNGAQLGGSTVVWWSNTALSAALNIVQPVNIKVDPLADDVNLHGLWVSFNTSSADGYVIFHYDHIE